MDIAPLAHRVRPRTLQEFVGQAEVLGPGKPLRQAIENDSLRSVILSGPPGTGKTTIAGIIAESTKASFVRLNAVTSGVKDIKAVCAQAEELLRGLQQRTVLFIDEIHRFNTGQQDALLPFVENGTVILIGATTQNPYFDVNAALLSRSQVYLLTPLTLEDLVSILRSALEDPRGFDGKIRVSDEALLHIARVSNGDARIALNQLELAVSIAGKKVEVAEVEKLLSERRRRYDRKGEDHYNTISAFIKTLRGSDPDASLLWLFSMIQSGEDPKFLFRRMAIFASEDVGNADPRALGMVIDAWNAFSFVGLPEGEFFLAHACVYLAQAPKSNAITRAMGRARELLAKAGTAEIPNHLRNAPVKGMRQQGYGRGYQYPHDDPRGVVAGNYFPVGIPPQILYEPSERGFEGEVRERLRHVREVLRSVSP